MSGGTAPRGRDGRVRRRARPRRLPGARRRGCRQRARRSGGRRRGRGRPDRAAAGARRRDRRPRPGRRCCGDGAGRRGRRAAVLLHRARGGAVRHRGPRRPAPCGRCWAPAVSPASSRPARSARSAAAATCTRFTASVLVLSAAPNRPLTGWHTDRHEHPPAGHHRGHQGRPRAARGRHPGHPGAGLAAAVGAGRRPGLAQVREPPAGRLVQDPRRLHPDLAARPRTRRARGVVAASAGNHAQGVALAASLRGHPRRRCSCRRARRSRRCRRPRPTAPRCASTAPRSTRRCRRRTAFAEETGAVLVHPFDHPDIVAGQGTVGLEILEQVPDVRTVVVCTGGGGLLAGIALAVKSTRPDVRVVGVQAESAAAYPASLAAGAPGAAGPDVDDGRRHRGRLPRAGAVRASSRSWSTTSSRSPRSRCRGPCCCAWSGPSWWSSRPVPPGSRRCWTTRGPSSRRSRSCSPAATSTRCCCCGCCGTAWRSPAGSCRCRARISDRPGALVQLLAEVAAADASVLEVEHVRTDPRLRVDEVEVRLQLETRGEEHCDERARPAAGRGLPARARLTGVPPLDSGNSRCIVSRERDTSCFGSTCPAMRNRLAACRTQQRGSSDRE